MKDSKELRNLSVDDLQAELLTLRKEQFNLRLRKANGSMDKTHLITLVRKSIARVKTIISEKVGMSNDK